MSDNQCRDDFNSQIPADEKAIFNAMAATIQIDDWVEPVTASIEGWTVWQRVEFSVQSPGSNSTHRLTIDSIRDTLISTIHILSVDASISCYLALNFAFFGADRSR